MTLVEDELKESAVRKHALIDLGLVWKVVRQSYGILKEVIARLRK